MIPPDYDIVVVRFSVHGYGQPAEEAVSFVKEYCAGKKVALFVTHAAPEDSLYVPPWLEACKEAATTSQLLGLANFQVQIALQKADEALQSADVDLLEMIKNVVHLSLGQPDAQQGDGGCIPKAAGSLNLTVLIKEKGGAVLL